MDTDSRTSRSHRDHPRSPLVPVATAFVSGMTCDLLWHPPLSAWLIGSGIAILILLATPRCRGLGVPLVLVLVASAGGLRHQLGWWTVGGHDVSGWLQSDRQLARLTAVLLTRPVTITPPPGAPAHVSATTRFEVRAETIRVDHAERPVGGRVSVIVRGRWNNGRVGDRVRLMGWLLAPRPARNPGGFDTRAWLARRNIHAQMQVATAGGMTVLEASSDPRDIARHRLAQLRQLGHRLLHRHLSARTAPIASAMLLGNRDEVSRDDRLAFMRSGTMHLLAISGLHVGLLAGLVLLVARTLGLRPGLAGICTLAAIVSYALVAEFRPSVLRATILVGITIWGRAVLRRAAAANAVALAAILVLAWRPGDLQSPGAWLSFVAVSAVLWATPRSARLIPVPRTAGCVGRVVVSLLRMWFVGSVAWLATAPLVAGVFGLIAPAGLVVNVLVIPIVAVGLWIGVGLLCTAGWMPGAGPVLGAMLDAVLNVVLEIARVSSWGHIDVPSPTVAWLAACYGLMAITASLRQRSLRSHMIVVFVAMIVLALSLRFALPTHDSLRMLVLDAGHGGAILVQFPSGRVVLFDAGTLGNATQLARTIRHGLWHTGARRIDAMVLSHADRDHFCSAAPVLEILPVGTLVAAPTFGQSRQPGVAELFEMAVSKGIPLEWVVAGDRLRLDQSTEVIIRHPAIGFRGSTDNSNSLVVEIVYAGRRILLTGDLEHEGLWALCQSPAIPCDLILSPHHGSPIANTRAFAAWSSPRRVVVSGGRRTTRSRLLAVYGPRTQILETRRLGAIEVTVGPDGHLTIATAIKDSL